MNLICPRCGNKVNPNTKRPQCGKCKYLFPRNKSSKTHPKLIQISDDIMRGNIFDVIKNNIIPRKKEKNDFWRFFLNQKPD